MAGLLKPGAAKVLFTALREATSLPIHFHTHDTSGIAAASVLAAVDAGVDVVDAAMDAFSGDSIPTHLLTLEAFEAYRRHLKPEGWLAVHVTNTYLDLRPVMAAAAAHLGRVAVLLELYVDLMLLPGANRSRQLP